MLPDTLVQLPTITAAQRQLLISVLETENRRRSAMGARKAADSVVALAHALDLHLDAVRAETPVENAAPRTLHDGEHDEHINHPHWGTLCMVPGWERDLHAAPSTDAPARNAAPDSTSCAGTGRAWTTGTGNPMCPVCRRGWRSLQVAVRPARGKGTVPSHTPPPR